VRVLSKSQPPLAVAIVEQLLARGTGPISLDALADAIGTAPVTLQDIEAMLDGLEAAGRHVESKPTDAPATLTKVLATVRGFSALSGRRPTLPEIAQHSGLSLGEVRFALLYARVLAG
jgi:hypothetical protein